MAMELKGIEAIKYKLTSKELLKFVEENRIRIRRLEQRLAKQEKKNQKAKRK